MVNSQNVLDILRSNEESYVRGKGEDNESCYLSSTCSVSTS